MKSPELELLKVIFNVSYWDFLKITGFEDSPRRLVQFNVLRSDLFGMLCSFEASVVDKLFEYARGKLR